MFCEDEDYVKDGGYDRSFSPCYAADPDTSKRCKYHEGYYKNKWSTTFDNYWDLFSSVSTYLIQCNYSQTSGICYYSGGWKRWKSCDQGSESIITIVRDTYRRRNLRSEESEDDSADDAHTEIEVDIDGETFVIVDPHEE